MTRVTQHTIVDGAHRYRSQGQGTKRKGGADGGLALPAPKSLRLEGARSRLSVSPDPRVRQIGRDFASARPDAEPEGFDPIPSEPAPAEPARHVWVHPELQALRDAAVEAARRGAVEEPDG